MIRTVAYWKNIPVLWKDGEKAEEDFAGEMPPNTEMFDRVEVCNFKSDEQFERWWEDQQTRYKTLVFGIDDCFLLEHALSSRLKEVRAEVEILKKARERPLTKPEYWMLSSNLQKLNRDELLEQIDPWISLVMHYESLIEEISGEQVTPD